MHTLFGVRRKKWGRGSFGSGGRVKGAVTVVVFSVVIILCVSDICLILCFICFKCLYLPQQWLIVVCLHNVPCIYLSQRLQMEITLWLYSGAKHFLSCIREEMLYYNNNNIINKHFPVSKHLMLSDADALTAISPGGM